MNFGGLAAFAPQLMPGLVIARSPTGDEAIQRFLSKRLDCFARDNGVLPAHALRAGIAQCGRGDQPIGHSERNFGPADAPGRTGAVPPDPAPSVVKAHQRVIGASGREGSTDCQHRGSKDQSLHRRVPSLSEVSRAQRSTISAFTRVLRALWWCAAEPGSLQTPSVERSRICGAPAMARLRA
jgi:hypothetical protein